MAISGTYSDGDAIQGNDCEVEIDLTPASSAFANIDSWSTTVVPNEKTAPSTDAYTFTHSGAISFYGNPAPRTVDITVVYTEGTTDPYVNLVNVAIGTAVDVRWSIAGGASGDYQNTTSGGKLDSFTPPQPAADGSTAMTFSFRIKAPSITHGVIA